MSGLNITKSKFMEYIRCKRFPALNHIYKRKDMDDALKDRFYDLMDSLEYVDEFDEQSLEPDLSHLETMMPYFNEVEVLSARKVMSLFGGDTKYGIKYGEQKLFMKDRKNFNLMCYVDIFNRSEDMVRIIEVKATTSNKFLSMTYTEDKVKKHLFYVDDNNVLHLMETIRPEVLENSKYLKQRKKLFDRLEGTGVYVYDLAFQRYVIEEDLPNAKYYLGVLNHEYEFDGSYIADKPNYTEDIIRLIDLTGITKELQPQIENDIDTVIKRITEDDESRVLLGKHCQLKKMRECIYKDLCYDMLPKKNNIMMYLDKHHGFKEDDGTKHDYFDLLNEGYVSMEDVPHNWLNRRNNRIQREVAISHEPYVDIGKIRSAIGVIKYPIYHLDFESFPCPLPRFKGERPYMQSLFQFSLHIERAAGQCDKERDHYEFLAKDHNDNRLELVKQLTKHIKQDGGSVLVYNEAFEKTRIKELAAFFPEYKDQLLDINERLFDLLHVVKTNSKLFSMLGYDDERAKVINYYHEDLSGSFSIKKVLPIFSSLTYKGMEVSNGMEAVYAYASYSDLNEEERNEKQQALVEYCKQDTWAMVEILEELRKM